jgi:hypothetical protein
MTHIYGASHTRLVDMGMLDNYVLLMYVGFFGNLNDTLLKLAGLRADMSNSFSDDCAAAARAASADTVAALAKDE